MSTNTSPTQLGEHGNHDDHGGAHETSDASFGNGLWLIPVSMALLIVYVYICWFGATKTLKHEIASKGGIVAADSIPPAPETP